MLLAGTGSGGGLVLAVNLPCCGEKFNVDAS